MAGKGGVWDRLKQERMLARWVEAARKVPSARPSTVRAQQEQALRLRPHLDLFLHRADERLRMPLNGERSLARDGRAEWAWRPELWRAHWPGTACAPLASGATVGTETSFYHDARLAEIALRQSPNLRETDLSPFRLDLDVLGFDGGFLSLVLDLPQDGVDGLSRDHIVQVCLNAELEAPLDTFVRLNVQHGPNTEKMTLEVPPTHIETVLDFDLAYSAVNEKRVEKAWIDLIFESPRMNRISLRDITVSRRLRAAL